MVGCVFSLARSPARRRSSTIGIRAKQNTSIRNWKTQKARTKRPQQQQQPSFARPLAHLQSPPLPLIWAGNRTRARPELTLDGRLLIVGPEVQARALFCGPLEHRSHLEWRVHCAALNSARPARRVEIAPKFRDNFRSLTVGARRPRRKWPIWLLSVCIVPLASSCCLRRKRATYRLGSRGQFCVFLGQTDRQTDRQTNN